MQRLINSNYLIYFTATVISLLISFWINSHENLLNPDAICYLQGAETVTQGLSKAMSVCDQNKWPFYSLLIAGFVKVTAVSYEHAAFILNAIFSALTMIVFIRIVAEFSNKKSILWLAAVVFLACHEFNTLKAEVIRDHGFWFSYLLSVLFLLRYFKEKTIKYALGWSASIILATLFRIEGIVFLLAIPGLVWLEKGESFTHRLKSFLSLNALLILAGTALFTIVITHPGISLGRLYELPRHLENFYSGVIQNYINLANGMSNILGRSGSDRYIFYFFALSLWYLSIVINALSPIYFILLIYAWIKKTFTLPKNAKLILWGYIVINFLMTYVFLIENQFLSKRYLMALVLILMLWIPFALESFVKVWQQRKWPCVLVVFCITISGMTGIMHFGDSKQYIRDASDWLNENTSKTATIYSNDVRVLYYSEHFGNQIFENNKDYANLRKLENGKWKNYNYLAIVLSKTTSREDIAFIKEINKTPLIVFKGKHAQDQVRIYQGS